MGNFPLLILDLSYQLKCLLAQQGRPLLRHNILLLLLLLLLLILSRLIIFYIYY
jgi:hypothetical protein